MAAGPEAWCRTKWALQRERLVDLAARERDEADKTEARRTGGEEEGERKTIGQQKGSHTPRMHACTHAQPYPACARVMLGLGLGLRLHASAFHPLSLFRLRLPTMAAPSRPSVASESAATPGLPRRAEAPFENTERQKRSRTSASRMLACLTCFHCSSEREEGERGASGRISSRQVSGSVEVHFPAHRIVPLEIQSRQLPGSSKDSGSGAKLHAAAVARLHRFVPLRR